MARLSEGRAQHSGMDQHEPLFLRAAEGRGGSYPEGQAQARQNGGAPHEKGHDAMVAPGPGFHA